MTIDTCLDRTYQPRRLSPAQIDQYQKEGFLVLRDVFSRELIYELGEEADRVVRQRPELLNRLNMRVRFKPHFQTSIPIFEAFDPFADLSSVAQSVVRDTYMLELIGDLYGEPAELFKDKLIFKPAGAEGVALHQDWISWPGFPESFLTVLVAIDSFTKESGATEVYPGLHRGGYLSDKDGTFHVLSSQELDVKPIPLLLEPGDIAIFGCFLPHGAAPNKDSQPRRGYFVSYNAQSDGGNQYADHYREFHDWIRAKAAADVRDRLYFH